MVALYQSEVLSLELLDCGVLVADIDNAKLLEALGSGNPQHASMSAKFPVASVMLPDAFPPEGTFDQVDIHQHYQVSFTLGFPHVNTDQLVPNSLGDSLLNFAPIPKRIFVEARGTDGVPLKVAMVLVPNEHGRLAKLVAFIPGHVPDDESEAIGYACVRTYLSQLSAVYQVPLDVALVERFYVKTPDVVEYVRTINVPYPVKQLDVSDITPLQACWQFKSFARAVNHYREGANAANPMQRFLSWYKALEAIMALRTELAKRDKNIKFPKTKLPDTPFFRSKYPELIDQTHTTIYSRDLLKKEYRDAVAHWGKDDDLAMSSDQRSGVLLYQKLSVLAGDIFNGLFSATIEAANAKTTGS